MDQEKSYTTASLTPQLINEIKSLEEKLRDQTSKDVVVIAYEKDKNGIQ